MTTDFKALSKACLEITYGPRNGEISKITTKWDSVRTTIMQMMRELQRPERYSSISSSPNTAQSFKNDLDQLVSLVEIVISGGKGNFRLEQVHSNIATKIHTMETLESIVKYYKSDLNRDLQGIESNLPTELEP